MRYSSLHLVGVAAGLLVFSLTRDAGAQLANNNLSPPRSGYVGSEVCQGCHAEQAEKFAATPMGQIFLKSPRTAVEKQGCEGCHGPGSDHVEAGGGKGVGGLITYARTDRTSVEQRNAQCLRCHEKTARMFWKGSSHESRDVPCTSCHTVMTTTSERSQLKRASVVETCAQCHQQRAAQLARFSHMPFKEGKLDCVSCHNPHGTAQEKLLKGNAVNDVCYSCHAEKRGPFLWQHPPVVESCANCHEAHGSNNEKMLKVPKPRLCQQCHDEQSHPTRPYNNQLGTQTRFLNNRQCTNCHINIHGSNHPSGNRFTR